MQLKAVTGIYDSGTLISLDRRDVARSENAGRYPDFTRYPVQQLKVLCPSIGRGAAMSPLSMLSLSASAFVSQPKHHSMSRV